MTEFLTAPVVWGALTVAGFVALVIRWRLSKADRDAVVEWPRVYATVNHKRTGVAEGGGTTYLTQVSTPDRPRRRVRVRAGTWDGLEIGDQVELAQHPRYQGHLVHPELPLDHPRLQALFVVGLSAFLFGFIVGIIGVFVEL